MMTRPRNRSCRHRTCAAFIVSVAWIGPAMATPPAPPPLACKASAGIGPLIAGKDALLVGEVHGTAESPAFVAETACTALASGRAVSVALEIPVAEQARLAAFVASAGTAADRAALLSGDFWRDPYQDGRASVAMVELLERLRTFRQAGRPIAVVAIDPGPGMDGQERERSMADRLRALVAAAPHDLLIVLTGNFHTRLKPRGSYAYTGSVLSQGNPALRVAALNVAYSGGSAWICQSADAAGCKPVRLGNQAGASFCRLTLRVPFACPGLPHKATSCTKRRFLWSVSVTRRRLRVSAVARPQPIDLPAVVDRPAPPVGQRRASIHVHAVARESRGQGRDGLACRHRQRRRLRERPAVGAIEARFAVGRQLHREALLVHRAMMAAAQQQGVAEAGGAAIGPGLDVVGVAQLPAAAREAAAAVAMLEGAAQAWRDGACAAADVEHAAIRGVPHHHPCESQASRRDVSAETWLPSASQDEPPSPPAASTSASTCTTT
jgi:hypothetical protein